MALNYNSEAACEFLSSAFQWIVNKFKKLWSVLTSIKLLIWTITILFVITGLSLLIVGIVVLVMCNNYFILIDNTFFLLPVFMIGTAVIIFLTACLGFHGVTRNKYDYVVSFITLLVTILMFEITVTVLGFALQDNAWQGNVVLYKMHEYMQEFINGGWGRSFWNTMQRELRCCGIKGVSDFGNRIPLSCCYDITTFSPFECTSSNSTYYGCYYSLAGLVSEYAFAIAITAATASCLQVVITAIAVYLAYRVKRQQEIPYKGLLESPINQGSKANYNSIPGLIVGGPDSNDII
ncbi:leukocyte surface antigen CD53-like [Maniola jurtina]|uniref:leukocyte surface antigen CD53-like n=1 Tax=Maniola jurtina TaxID=191418 RepID=UPI001E688B72|nr:leukocyte surface antigen CD53-like [Maniola jurtina]